VFQPLVCPMLDDRTTQRTDIDESSFRLWDNASNRFSWRSYLGEAYPDDVPALAAPARYEDLSGLPPAWIGVGTDDLFHDEDVAYARRLQEAGVKCTLEVVPGLYHGFELAESNAPVSRAFVETKVSALADAFDADVPNATPAARLSGTS
jgi:acetyl esterase/lipase